VAGRRETLARFVLLPAVLVAVGILAYFTFRTTLQVERLRQQSVLEATLGLANEKADRLDKRIIDEDNVVMAIADPQRLTDLTTRWLPTARRETPTVRAILVLDEWNTVLAFASRAGGAFADEESFRRLLVQRMIPDMELAKQAPEELRHLHHEYRGQSYLLSYWQRVVQPPASSTAGRPHTYLVVAWHDVGRIVKEAMPALFSEAAATPARVNVLDEDGRIVYGPPLRSGEFTVSVRFPTTLYGWHVQVSPSASDELLARVENRAMLERVMVALSCVVIVLGVAVILLAAERQRRMSSLKSEFVANVSHELKTPLALVRMFAEMLQSGRVANEEKRQQYLDIIVGESERLSALIENVLDFARVERGRQAYEFAEGSIADAVSRAVNVYRYRAEREGVELVTELEPGLPTARIDERAIQLAVINLLDNALKYASGSEVVTVRVTRENGSVVVRVVDRGPGVPPEDRERIFERFVRGSTARGSGAGAPPVRGSGIGLALVKHIAESHGGRAWVEAGGAGAAGAVGASFAVSIPTPPPVDA
jgi:two-component system, OmpR family, phosphate regulon sensor histidine kinase PhoR